MKSPDAGGSLWRECESQERLGQKPSLEETAGSLKVMVWANGRVSLWGDPEKIRCFKEEWVREGLPITALFNVCG